WSWGCRAENVTKSRTSSLALVSSSTPRSPSMRACMAWPNRRNREATAARQCEEEDTRRPPQLVLRAVVVVQQRLRDAGALRDVAGRGAVERALREQVDRRGQDPVAGCIGW